MWDAALRARNGQPIVDRSDAENGRFIMSLCIGEMFEIDGGDDRPLLCVVQKMRQTDKRIHYHLHTDARVSGEKGKDNLSLVPDNMRRAHARKVTVDLLGRIRRAND